jgi:hypothetical protein
VQAAAHSTLTNYGDDIAAAINCDALVFGKGVCARADAFFCLPPSETRGDAKVECCKGKMFPRLFLNTSLIAAKRRLTSSLTQEFLKLL